MGVLDKKDVQNVYCCGTEGPGLGNTALNQYHSKLSQEKITTYSISETILIYIIITL